MSGAGATPAPGATFPPSEGTTAGGAAATLRDPAPRSADEAVASSGFYRAPVGTELTFDFDAEVTVHSRQQKEQLQSRMLGLALRGTQRWLVLGRRDGRLLCDFSYPRPDVTPSAPQSAMDCGRS